MSQTEYLKTVRFSTADQINLLGWLAEPAAKSDVVVIHIHGMSGNGFENELIDHLRQCHLAASRAFFSFNNRGAGVVTWLNRSDGSTALGGAAFEDFEHSALDISAAIEALRGLGYSRVILQGHSLGCAKALHFLTSATATIDVESVVLLAPTDMVGWGLRTSTMRDAADRAQAMVAAGQGAQLVADTCWDNGPLSANVTVGYTTPGGPSDFYGTGAARDLAVPVLVVYGTLDIGIVEVYADVEAWRQRAVAALPPHTKIEIIDGASHSFREALRELCEVVETFSG